jgi:hypothetical protein
MSGGTYNDRFSDGGDRSAIVGCCDRNADNKACDCKAKVSSPDTKPGYHMRPITKGVLGEVSKIREELEELEDAEQQGVLIMVMVELSDMYGAMKTYATKRGFTMHDLAQMSEVTERAFVTGRRS